MIAGGSEGNGGCSAGGLTIVLCVFCFHLSQFRMSWCNYDLYLAVYHEKSTPFARDTSEHILQHSPCQCCGLYCRDIRRQIADSESHVQNLSAQLEELESSRVSLEGEVKEAGLKSVEAQEEGNRRHDLHRQAESSLTQAKERQVSGLTVLLLLCISLSTVVPTFTFGICNNWGG